MTVPARSDLRVGDPVSWLPAGQAEPDRVKGSVLAILFMRDGESLVFVQQDGSHAFYCFEIEQLNQEDHP